MSTRPIDVSRWPGVAGMPDEATLHQDLLVASDPRRELLIGMTVMRPSGATVSLSHTEVEFVYVIEGRLTAVLDGVDHVLVEGSHTLLLPGTRHAFRNDSTTEAVMLFVFPRGRGDEPALLGGIAPPPPIHDREGETG
ncbi:cupin domain-containing protein [Nocardioides sp. LMS-CY]|uniref:cupin domain-containing protein n=1 Tax=Nocardioides sp. (strain LMS-CY) TaxID=2840457 RepID=UPI001BFFEE56|nr:cupin domain-containing protein [Nocardioides sp. LMS-CY]QWF22958.1 cupin domain-containing protein [Nocardioides sp. LMS-CY]